MKKLFDSLCNSFYIYGDRTRGCAIDYRVNIYRNLEESWKGVKNEACCHHRYFAIRYCVNGLNRVLDVFVWI